MFSRMFLLLKQDRMEVNNGLIVAATGATVETANAESNLSVKFTLVRIPLFHSSPFLISFDSYPVG